MQLPPQDTSGRTKEALSAALLRRALLKGIERYGSKSLKSPRLQRLAGRVERSAGREGRRLADNVLQTRYGGAAPDLWTRQSQAALREAFKRQLASSGRSNGKFPFINLKGTQPSYSRASSGPGPVVNLTSKSKHNLPTLLHELGHGVDAGAAGSARKFQLVGMPQAIPYKSLRNSALGSGAKKIKMEQAAWREARRMYQEYAKQMGRTQDPRMLQAMQQMRRAATNNYKAYDLKRAAKLLADRQNPVINNQSWALRKYTPPRPVATPQPVPTAPVAPVAPRPAPPLLAPPRPAPPLPVPSLPAPRPAVPTPQLSLPAPQTRLALPAPQPAAPKPNKRPFSMFDFESPVPMAGLMAGSMYHNKESSAKPTKLLPLVLEHLQKQAASRTKTAVPGAAWLDWGSLPGVQEDIDRIDKADAMRGPAPPPGDDPYGKYQQGWKKVFDPVVEFNTRQRTAPRTRMTDIERSQAATARHRANADRLQAQRLAYEANQRARQQAASQPKQPLAEGYRRMGDPNLFAEIQNAQRLQRERGITAARRRGREDALLTRRNAEGKVNVDHSVPKVLDHMRAASGVAPGPTSNTPEMQAALKSRPVGPTDTTPDDPMDRMFASEKYDDTLEARQRRTSPGWPQGPPPRPQGPTPTEQWAAATAPPATANPQQSVADWEMERKLALLNRRPIPPHPLGRGRTAPAPTPQPPSSPSSGGLFNFVSNGLNTLNNTAQGLGQRLQQYRNNQQQADASRPASPPYSNYVSNGLNNGLDGLNTLNNSAQGLAQRAGQRVGQGLQQHQNNQQQQYLEDAFRPAPPLYSQQSRRLPRGNHNSAISQIAAEKHREQAQRAVTGPEAWRHTANAGSYAQNVTPDSNVFDPSDFAPPKPVQPVQALQPAKKQTDWSRLFDPSDFAPPKPIQAAKPAVKPFQALPSKASPFGASPFQAARGRAGVKPPPPKFLPLVRNSFK